MTVSTEALSTALPVASQFDDDTRTHVIALVEEVRSLPGRVWRDSSRPQRESHSCAATSDDAATPILHGAALAGHLPT